MLTSRSREYLIEPITPQGVVLIINGIILLHFGITSLVKWFLPQYRNEALLFPLFSNQHINNIIAIFSLITYLSLILFYWIPSLPINEQSLPLAAFGIPLFLLSILTVVVIVLSYSIAFFRVETIVIVDINQRNLTLKGRTILGKKFLLNLSFDEATQLILQPFEFTRDNNLENSISSNTNVWGIFIEHDDKKILVHANKKENSEKYVKELANLTSWNYTTKPDGTYVNSDKLALAIVR